MKQLSLTTEDRSSAIIVGILTLIALLAATLLSMEGKPAGEAWTIAAAGAAAVAHRLSATQHSPDTTEDRSSAQP